MLTYVTMLRTAGIGAIVAAVVGLNYQSNKETPEIVGAGVADVRIPRSIEIEHLAIQQEILAATMKPSEVGKSARALAKVLEPHFDREEQIALPQLGTLYPLATGARIPEATRMLALADSLRAELPRMLAEHKEIIIAVARLERAGIKARDLGAIALAHRLQQHALQEEEVLYPAAVLVSDVIRYRGAVANQ